MSLKKISEDLKKSIKNAEKEESSDVAVAMLHQAAFAQTTEHLAAEYEKFMAKEREASVKKFIKDKKAELKDAPEAVVNAASAVIRRLGGTI